MKKILFTIILLLFAMPTVLAGSVSSSISSTSVSVGATVKVTVRTSNAAGMVRVSSSNAAVLSGGGSDFVESSYTFSFKAKKSGTATITVATTDVTGTDEKAVKYTKKYTVKVGNKSSNNTSKNNDTKNKTNDDDKPKSSINTLDSLSISGHSISPKFDQNTSEYTVDLDTNIESIKINAKATDSNAIVSGIGNRKVNEGMNTLTITVRAENGSKRIYTIKANVKEKNPIQVKIGDRNYTIVKKEKDLPIVSDYYQITKVKIDDQEVPAYYSEVTKYTLVALKDEQGTIGLYIYDSQTSKYLSYREIEFSRMIIYLKSFENIDIPKDFKKTSLKLEEGSFEAYRYKNSDYYLVYGVNVDTGEENLYLYDKKENTIQRYFDLQTEEFDHTIEKQYKVIFILGVACVGFCLSSLLVILRMRKKVN